MHRETLNLLTLLGFGLILLSFLVRGFGQFLVGPEAALGYAGPVAALAAAVILVTVLAWTLDRLGVVRLED